jgi:hypothetical protein
MKSVSNAFYLITTFFVATMASAFYYYRQFPALAVAAEASPGTWLSGVLLCCCAGIALVLVIHRGWNPWALVVVFFFLMAADEHFMLHERIKQWLIFNMDKPVLLIREMPVFIGAIIGGCIAWALWRESAGASRKLLIAAVFFGLMSVTLDVIGASAMWEEILKLIAELTIVCALLLEAGRIYKPDKHPGVH